MSKSRQKAAIKTLKEYGIQSGSSIYTSVLHVSRSGMSRTIATYILYDGSIVSIENVSWEVANALGWAYDYKRRGVKVKGTGMDMASHLVYCLELAMGMTLHPDSL